MGGSVCRKEEIQKTEKPGNPHAHSKGLISVFGCVKEERRETNLLTLTVGLTALAYIYLTDVCNVRAHLIGWLIPSSPLPSANNFYHQPSAPTAHLPTFAVFPYLRSISSSPSMPTINRVYCLPSFSYVYLSFLFYAPSRVSSFYSTFTIFNIK